MKKNFLFAMLTVLLASFGFGGISLADDVDVSSDVSTKASSLVSTYYNKCTNGDTITINGEKGLCTRLDTSKFYQIVGDYTGDTVDSITINGTLYDNSDKKTSIGKNAYILAPSRRINEGKLEVAVPLLIAEAMPGSGSEIIAGSSSYEVTVFSSETKLLSISNSVVPNEEKQHIVVNGSNIYVFSKEKNLYAGFVLNNGTTNITDTSIFWFRLTPSDQSMGISPVDGNTGGKDYTYWAYYDGYQSGFTGYSETELDIDKGEFKISIPGEGSILVHTYYTRLQTSKNYKFVDFNSAGGSFVKSVAVAEDNSKYVLPELATPTRTGFAFTGWYNGDTKVVAGDEITANVVLTAHWEQLYKVTTGEISNGTVTASEYEVLPGTQITLTATPESNYKFGSWSVKAADNSDIEVNGNQFTMPNQNVTVTATFTYIPRSKTSGGSSSSSSAKTDDSKATTGDTAKADEDKKADDSKATTGDTAKTDDDTKADDSKGSEGGNDGASASESTFSQEFKDAYEFAFKNGITTQKSIEEADMYGALTRIAMAKMLSQYAINVLGKTPDTSKVVPTFSDVDAQLDADYNNGVTLAYQLGIMGIGIQDFRPFDTVTRAEFGTALSRMLYGLADGEGNEYYSTHLAKLMSEKIITNDTPDLKELRGYVMIMLMRSAQ